MFDTTFATSSITIEQPQVSKAPVKYKKRELLIWEEHCLECAPPYCYNNCPLYQTREDKKCVRMRYGLQPTNEFAGSLPYGIDCTFRKWAKIEAKYANKCGGNKLYAFYDNANHVLSKAFLALARLLKPIWPTLKPYGAFVAFRRHLVWGSHETPELFYIKCHLKNKDHIQLLIQIDADKILYSKSFLLNKGMNEFSIPLNHCLDGISSARIFLAPLNEETDTEIVFEWLDLFSGITSDVPKEEPAKKVKVVAWDLDNTLWDGTLVNDKNVKLRENALKVIKALDEKGILNTISSKNDYDEAIAKLREFGIEEYFLSPAINWGQKSQNIQKIAEILNLGINSFAFVDDNIRERAEVKESLPMVRVYSDQEIDQLLSYPEFDIPISTESKNRRHSYQQEVSRQQFREEFADNYDSFLKSLEMELTVETVGDENRARCYELLSRSNQLNLSTNRYSSEEYEKLINNKDTLCYSYRCNDKFGDYGIIAFTSVKLQGSTADLIDFVISCRVAKKRVEEAIICTMAQILAQKDVHALNARLIRTKKNGPLASVFEELPFKMESSDNDSIQYYLQPLDKIEQPQIIKIHIK